MLQIKNVVIIVVVIIIIIINIIIIIIIIIIRRVFIRVLILCPSSIGNYSARSDLGTAYFVLKDLGSTVQTCSALQIRENWKDWASDSEVYTVGQKSK